MSVRRFLPNIKKILLQFNLLDPARLLYSFLKKFSIGGALEELKFRKDGLPDHFPAPPAYLAFLVIRSPWAFEYWNSGLKIINDLEVHLKHHNIPSDRFHKILDFGCGCARLTRQLTRFQNAQIYGSDYNHRLIEWCRKNLTFGEFSQNKLEPPLSFESEYFDLVLARSVFTHLDQHLQREWIRELHRIIARGGFLYFSTHSGAPVPGIGSGRSADFDGEGFVSQNSGLQGDNKCSAYETKEWVEKNLSAGFTIIDYIPGRPEEHLGQDIFLFQKIA